MAAGSSWSWKPPRGVSAEEGNLVRRGRSRVRISYANRTAEWGWTVPAPSPASARAELGLSSTCSSWHGLGCGASRARQRRGDARLDAPSRSNCRSRKTLRPRPSQTVRIGAPTRRQLVFIGFLLFAPSKRWRKTTAPNPELRRSTHLQPVPSAA